MYWLVAADLVALIHAGYIAFVVVGFVAIVVGWAARWHWVRNLYFRAVHLAMILFVCCEAIMGTTCPLTLWENALRIRGGESGSSRDFIGYWLDRLIFYNAPAWVFTSAYLAFGALVLLTLWFVPVNWPTASRSSLPHRRA
jgi:Protein of Unknown function (DUF2784)